MFVKGMLGRCAPFALRGTSAYFVAAISVISRGWSSPVSCMRLNVWIVVGSEVMVQGYLRRDVVGTGYCTEKTFMVVSVS